MTRRMMKRINKKMKIMIRKWMNPKKRKLKGKLKKRINKKTNRWMNKNNNRKELKAKMMKIICGSMILTMMKKASMYGVKRVKIMSGIIRKTRTLMKGET